MQAKGSLQAGSRVYKPKTYVQAKPEYVHKEQKAVSVKTNISNPLLKFSEKQQQFLNNSQKHFLLETLIEEGQKAALSSANKEEKEYVLSFSKFSRSEILAEIKRLSDLLIEPLTD